MNKKGQLYTNQKALYFKRWRNKGYAAFSSCLKVVHIGHLSLAMVDWIGRVVEHVETLFVRLTNAASNLDGPEEEELLSELELLKRESGLLLLVPKMVPAAFSCSTKNRFFLNFID